MNAVAQLILLIAVLVGCGGGAVMLSRWTLQAILGLMGTRQNLH